MSMSLVLSWSALVADDVAPPFDAGRVVLVMLGRYTVLSKAHAAKQCVQRDDPDSNPASADDSVTDCCCFRDLTVVHTLELELSTILSRFP
jgi:hypothetical protein